MNDLRSLEGIGQLLSQKFNQNNKHKLRSRNRRNSDSLISSSTVSTPTPTTNTTTPISEYFPAEIASLLSNNIQMGYYSNITSQAPVLLKSHSDFVREDIINHINNTHISDSDTNNNTDEQKCIILNLPIDINTHNNYSNSNINNMEREQSLSMTLAPPPSLAPLILEDDYSNNINFSSITDHMADEADDYDHNIDINILPISSIDGYYGDIIAYNDLSDDEDIELFDLKNDYMQYQMNNISRNTFNNIGNGASGIVRKAFHYKSCQIVAIKQCRSKQKHEIESFIRESKLYFEFEYCNNIINILEYGKDINDNDLYIILEYMDLGSTDKLKIYNTNYNINKKELIVAYIIKNVLNALNQLHNKLYIHNDIKPANILCNKYGKVKLSDFGTVLKLNDKYEYATKNNGTQMYQSPEKLTKNICKFNAKTDIWSLGITAYELLFGPRKDDNELSYITSPPQLSPIQHGLSEYCCDFINKCLLYNDKQRPSSYELLSHPFITQIATHKLNINMWPWLTPIHINNKIQTPKNKNTILNKNKFKRRSLTDLRHHEYYNEDLLFMISALIIYYSTKKFNDKNNGAIHGLHRRVSVKTDDKNVTTYSDEQRIENVAKYALCSKDTVMDRIKVTVSYIKSQLNKVEMKM
eukprot:188067_1